ncbi:MAG TPA: selenide, water dikinase SelD [Chthoniobacterales bacterium]|nr:selenide, water dikinase SelD [Chthoniobacterales bacterium]
MSQQALTQVLRQLPTYRNANVLVNSSTFDDAGVYRLDLSRRSDAKADRHRALVQTVDFFTPIVDDPFAYGQIAAANALSDVFAMGGRPITALNLMGFPMNLVSPETIAAILRGGLKKAAEVGCAIIGGHSIRNPEPIYGLAVTGVVDLRNILANENARPGDLLLLTKPLGTGIATTAIKRGLASRALEKKVIALMSQTNSVGADLAEKRLVRAATDITGFGLLGHLANMCRASKVSAEIFPDRTPAISGEIFELIKRDCIPGGTRDNLKAARATADLKSSSPVQRTFLADAQTSGGLLLCVPESRLSQVSRLLKKARTPCAAVIGRITRRRKDLICTTK